MVIYLHRKYNLSDICDVFFKNQIQKWHFLFHIHAARTLRHFFVGPKGRYDTCLPMR